MLDLQHGRLEHFCLQTTINKYKMEGINNGSITAAMVKELREMTGAGMMDCKKALAATDGDMDKAVEFLREKGLAGAEKKAGRIAAEGIVATAMTEDEKKAVVVEVNAETDFVAKNEKFQTYVAEVAAQALNYHRSRYGCIHGREVGSRRDLHDRERGSVFPDLHHR